MRATTAAIIKIAIMITNDKITGSKAPATIPKKNDNLAEAPISASRNIQM